MEHADHTEIAARLDQLTELSVELSKNRDMPVLLEHILRVAKAMTHADGGTLYRISADKPGHVSGRRVGRTDRNPADSTV